MAQTLNAEGWRPAKRRATFTPLMVGRLLARQGLHYLTPVRAQPLGRAADEWRSSTRFMADYRPSAWRAAAIPAASPVARQVPITRADPRASWDALMQRPATRRFSTSRA